MTKERRKQVKEPNVFQKKRPALAALCLLAGSTVQAKLSKESLAA